MTKKIDFKEKNPSELTALLAQKREELRALRFSAAGSRMKDASAPRKLRADVARILTELSSRAA
ncbi:MAG: 50S ribosomal protein L29 [Patescibacteria group bacterium]